MAETDPRPRQAHRPRVGLIFVGAVLGLVLLLSLVGDRGLLQLYRMARVKAHLEQEVEVLERGNALLRQEVEALRHHSSRSEEIARQDLGLVRPGEVVYQFRKR
jgi:cell division protein FtsB